MYYPARKIVRHREKNAPILLIGFILMTAMAISYILTNDGYIYILLAISGIVLLIFSVFWRQGLYFLFFYLCIEGIISLLFYQWKLSLIIKDFILISIYIGFLAEYLRYRKKIFFKNGLNFFLALLFGLSIIQFFNPKIDNLYVGLIGIKTMLLYIPLMYIGYHSFRTKQDLHNFVLFLAILAIPISLIGVIQYIAGMQVVADLGAGFEKSIVGIGTPTGYGVFRPSSTFSSPGHFGGYLLPMVLITFSFANFKYLGWKKHLFWLSFGLLILGLFANTQRSTIVVLTLAIPIMYKIEKRRIISYKILVILGIVLLFSWYNLRGVFYRIDSITRDPYQEIVIDHLVNPMLNQVSEALIESPLGQGLGSGSPGSRYLLQNWEFRESFLAYLIYELGIPGFIIYSTLIVVLLNSSFQIYHKLNDHDFRWFALGLLFYQLGIISQLGTYCPLNFAPTNIFFWFFTGVMMKLSVMNISNDLVMLNEKNDCSMVRLSKNSTSASSYNNYISRKIFQGEATRCRLW